ncbi:MAG TPA: 16S rRNA (guanine(527)-N(7))-methyltransferase RsmG [Solirubrobacteraceae bacterium]|nr:16S rRNA (guanine(527)-N(7))-methyltransferase RsmG [Solirubrobacteraceae bacterium]
MLDAFADRYGLDAEAVSRLRALTDLLVHDRQAPTTIRSLQGVLNDHLADSLVALELEALRQAGAVLDLGAGAGLPGLPLAIARPEARITLLEASARKCAFIERALDAIGLPNAEVIHDRAESFAAGRARYDVVTARAVAPPAVTLEYAAPLLRVGGTAILWRGRRQPEVDSALTTAAAELGLGQPGIHRVHPYRGAVNRHLYVVGKLEETPPRFPRRPGVALKRPLGAKIARPAAPSDRVQR